VCTNWSLLRDALLYALINFLFSVMNCVGYLRMDVFNYFFYLNVNVNFLCLLSGLTKRSDHLMPQKQVYDMMGFIESKSVGVRMEYR
jgi:hypothetical protein